MSDNPPSRSRRVEDALGLIVWTADEDARAESLNRYWHEYTGLPEDGGPLDWRRAVHPEDLEGLLCDFRRALRGRAPLKRELRLRGRDGRYRWFLIQGGRLGGEPRMAGFAIDIHEQVSMRAELAAQEAETRLLLDSARAMIWYKDRDNRILRCNRAAAESLGLSVAEMEGRSTYDLYPEAHARRYHRDDIAVIESGQPRLGIIEPYRKACGEELWIRTDKVPHRDAAGRVDGVIVFSVDVTELKRAEDLTRESEERQRAFVANVSHELRTPVAAIKGFAETLRRGALREPRSRMRFVRIIESHADRLSWIVEDLLTLSALESGKAMDLRPVALAKEVGEYLSSISSLSATKRLKLSSRVPKGLCALADRPHLLQALENLVGNALKYTPSGGSVRVEGAAEGEWARLTVRDTGPGIAPEHLERVFDRFYRVEKSRQGGSGLGLHIVRKIAAAHGGRVWAESRLGKGAAFHLRLPRAPVKPS